MNIELFASSVFGDEAMKSRLPEDIYNAIRKTVSRAKHLELDAAHAVADAMKTWAIEKGATHYAHWFQPMSGVTAEKHESFITPKDNKAILEFSGTALVRGEPDASAFPSGGLRATFEARGYTAWDPTAYAFIKDRTLYIPTAFCSYSGDALDKKTPLLRSAQAVNMQVLRILKLFGNDKAKHVDVTVGAEQEYFLIDKAMFLRRPDLIYCGRTLLGAKPPKGQELEDHYFGTIKPRVKAFMKELNEELWKLGVFAKVEHNEAAPAQHELAPVFSVVNTAADHNQLTMELMRTVADKHGLTCLLHEAPFAGISGSGKHINWSLHTDTGVNLLEPPQSGGNAGAGSAPGNTPQDNAQFLLFIAAVIKAADEYQDLLRVSVAGAGNDHRLGANEAPPAIVSLYLGDELTDILTAIENDETYHETEKRQMEIGVTALPHFPRDSADRNRTSPFAFTGNRFEFRMPGSSASVADSCVIINTIVADTLSEFAGVLEKKPDELSALIKNVIKKHKRIIFNGNNYAPEWEAEAEKRGLLNLRTTVDALPCLLTPKNVELFKRQGVFSESELTSRYEVSTENYCKLLHIEALATIELVRKELIPAVIAYQNDLAQLIKNKHTFVGFDGGLETRLLGLLSAQSAVLLDRLEELEQSAASVSGKSAAYYRNTVYGNTEALRETADELEGMLGRRYYNLPLYGEILYSVN